MASESQNLFWGGAGRGGGKGGRGGRADEKLLLSNKIWKTLLASFENFNIPPFWSSTIWPPPPPVTQAHTIPPLTLSRYRFISLWWNLISCGISSTARSFLLSSCYSKSSFPIYYILGARIGPPNYHGCHYKTYNSSEQWAGFPNRAPSNSNSWSSTNPVTPL